MFEELDLFGQFPTKTRRPTCPECIIQAAVSFHWLQWQGIRPQSTFVWTLSNPTKISGWVWSECGNKQHLALRDQNRKRHSSQQVLIDHNCFHLQWHKQGTTWWSGWQVWLWESCAGISPQVPSSTFQGLHRIVPNCVNWKRSQSTCI